MWCERCRQEVPGIAAGPTSPLGCARCGGPVTVTLDRKRSRGPGRDAADEASVNFEDEVFSDMTDWEQEIELAGLERSAAARSDRGWTTADERQVLESPHFAVASRATQRASRPRRSRVWLSPFLLFAGIAGLTCGVTFLGLSVYENRPALWELGLPVIALGQLALIMWVALEIGIPSPVESDPPSSRPSGRKRTAHRTERHEVLSAPVFTRSRRAARRGI